MGCTREAEEQEGQRLHSNWVAEVVKLAKLPVWTFYVEVNQAGQRDSRESFLVAREKRKDGQVICIALSISHEGKPHLRPTNGDRPIVTIKPSEVVNKGEFIVGAFLCGEDHEIWKAYRMKLGEQ